MKSKSKVREPAAENETAVAHTRSSVVVETQATVGQRSCCALINSLSFSNPNPKLAAPFRVNPSPSHEQRTTVHGPIPIRVNSRPFALKPSPSLPSFPSVRKIGGPHFFLPKPTFPYQTCPLFFRRVFRGNQVTRL